MTAKGVKTKDYTTKMIRDMNEKGTKLTRMGVPEKPEGKRPDRKKALQPHMGKGENTRYLRHSLAMWDLPPIDISDKDAVEERIVWYFNHCAEDDMKPTVTGLQLALGISADTFGRWCSGESRHGEYSEMVKKAKAIIEDQMNAYMENGKINPVSGIFLLKNHFGYQDKKDVTLTPGEQTMGEDKDPEELKQKYLEQIEDDE